MPAPMPLDAPVTTATLPASLPMGGSLSDGCDRTQEMDASIVRKIRTIGRTARGGYTQDVRPLVHPAIEDVTVEAILHALADPVRVAIYAQIIGSQFPQSCSSLMTVTDVAVPKSTLSQPFQVLREAGLI